RRTLYRYAEDAYSLSKELSLSREKMVFPLNLSEEECEEKFLDTVEFPLDPDAIHLFRTSLSLVSAFRNDAGRLILETDLEAEFLYTAEGRLRCLKKSFRYTLERNAPELPSRIQAEVVSAHFTLPAMRKSEIEAVIKFVIFTEEDAVLDVVTGWESAEKDLGGLPSYLLLRPEAGVTLFSLAKRTHSSPDLIAEANGISPDAAPPSDRLLLIPVIKGN
ncbi:MAG: LysM peptidoglycan-binding domain-containing protein, partial [Clostridia bacterium]|nr:LysM peptidoglycan-binding domain-containing protein [Clostridia bacterium]